MERNGLPWVWTDSIAGLEKASVIVLLGTETYTRQPIIDLRIRRAIRKGTRVYVVTPEPARLDRLAVGTIRYTPGRRYSSAGAAERCLERTVDARRLRDETRHQCRCAASVAGGVRRRYAGANAGADAEALRALAREIAQADGAVLLYDEMATREPTGATLAQDVLQLALLTAIMADPARALAHCWKTITRSARVIWDSCPISFLAICHWRMAHRLAAAWGESRNSRYGL